MMKIALVGAGGINSWVVENLKQICKTFDKEEFVYVRIFDEDVVEEKNLLRQHQNFLIDELMTNKAEALAKRYSYDFSPVYITEDNLIELEGFNYIIMGVDNHKVRRLLYKHCIEKKKYLLDLRAQGRQLAYYVLDLNKDMEYYDKKFFSNKEVMERKGSCQLQVDIDNDNIQSGNKIIAYFGIHGVFLSKIRGEEISTHEWKFVY